MDFRTFQLALLCLLLAHHAVGFGVLSTSMYKNSEKIDRHLPSRFLTICQGAVLDSLEGSTPEQNPAKVDIGGRYFQLEEQEDSETRFTGILLNDDGTVEALASDIPNFRDASGYWEQSRDGEVQMSLTRVYTAGHKSVRETDMGEFTYKMDRHYSGQMSFIGSQIAVSGAVKIVDDNGNSGDVGYFSMLDTEMDPSKSNFVPHAGLVGRSTMS